MMINGADDVVCPTEHVDKLVEKLNGQRGISIDYRVIPNCDHSFTGHLNTVKQYVTEYLNSKREMRKVV